MGKKNITISVDEKIAREARIMAAERDTSVSKLLAEKLKELVDARKQSVAARKAARVRTLTRREFGQETPVLCHALVQRAVRRRIYDAKPVPQHAYRAPADVEGCRVGDGIQTARHSTRHRESGSSESRGEVATHLGAVARV